MFVLGYCVKLVVSLQGRLRQTTTFCVKTIVHITKCEKITFTTISPYSHKPLLTAHSICCWPELPVFIMAVGKQWRGEAVFFFPPLSLSLSLSFALLLSMVRVNVEAAQQLSQTFSSRRSQEHADTQASSAAVNPLNPSH